MKNRFKLTVGQLKDLLKNLDDSTSVVVDGGDHSYRTASAIVVKAIQSSDGHLSEYYAQYADDEKVVTLLYIG
jgi:hypothetical protein